ncbi:MAG: PKD domain-containing protein [Janthinobacterium lividum]
MRTRYYFLASPLCRSLLGLAFSLLAFTARAQQPDSTNTERLVVAPAAECGPMYGGEMCVDFDASRSVDPGAGTLEYRWDMGDGTTLTGLTVSHCYKERRQYQIELNVVVVATGEVRQSERVFNIDLTKSSVLRFSVAPTTTIHVNQPVVFESLDSVLPSCQGTIVVWDFRDGFTQEGKRIEHTFRKPGHFQVRMSMQGYGGGTCSFSNCVSQEIVVEP